VPLIVIIIIPVALTGLAIYLLLRRRHRRQRAGGAPERASPLSPSAI
jgi:hypothetical protein